MQEERIENSWKEMGWLVWVECVRMLDREECETFLPVKDEILCVQNTCDYLSNSLCLSHGVINLFFKGENSNCKVETIIRNAFK